MLPGLRTLAAAVLLAFAIVTFAFGAAALLRVAHEDFAVLPTWRPSMEPLGETVAAPEPDMPVLAALRVEPQLEAPSQIAPDKPLAAPEPAPAEIVIAPAPPATTPPAAVVAALPEPTRAAAKIELPDAPYNAPLSGPRLMPEIATNDAPPVAVVSLAPATQDAETLDAEPLSVAPLPRVRPQPQIAKPLVKKRIVRRPPLRRVASRPVTRQTQPQSPLQQLFGGTN